MLQYLNVVDLRTLSACCRLLRKVTRDEALAASTQVRKNTVSVQHVPLSQHARAHSAQPGATWTSAAHQSSSCYCACGRLDARLPESCASAQPFNRLQPSWPSLCKSMQPWHDPMHHRTAFLVWGRDGAPKQWTCRHASSASASLIDRCSARRLPSPAIRRPSCRATSRPEPCA